MLTWSWITLKESFHLWPTWATRPSKRSHEEPVRAGSRDLILCDSYLHFPWVFFEAISVYTNTHAKSTCLSGSLYRGLQWTLLAYGEQRSNACIWVLAQKRGSHSEWCRLNNNKQRINWFEENNSWQESETWTNTNKPCQRGVSKPHVWIRGVLPASSDLSIEQFAGMECFGGIRLAQMTEEHEHSDFTWKY